MHALGGRVPGAPAMFLRGRLPATERRPLTAFAQALADIGALVRLAFAAGKTVRLLLPAVLSAVFIWPAPPALADFTQLGNKLVGQRRYCKRQPRQLRRGFRRR